MWLNNYYIKPLYILIAVAVIVVIAVIVIIKKLIAIIISIVVMGIFVYGGNEMILKNQVENVTKIINVGRQSIDKVKDLISDNVIKIKDGNTYIKINDEWYPYKSIKDNLVKKGEKYVFKSKKGIVEIESEELLSFLKDIK